MCFAPSSYIKTDGGRHDMFAIGSGVAQGCPASGSAWAIAMDPIIRHLASLVERTNGAPILDVGYLGARADDIGLLTNSFDTLRQVTAPFAAAEELAHLSLKPRKCFVVPLWSDAPPATIASTKALPAELGPPWGVFFGRGACQDLGHFSRTRYLVGLPMARP
ncbi:unnamed protein product [Prorocentrum cordatum]|uniref:Uncharacterized protein n=1 Tax=Prorocentrum cordatum TaxID=2364126 RepID=A0ABN9QPP0_9DINO|nr:unnamed protein product [Polarella glacialis]